MQARMESSSTDITWSTVAANGLLRLCVWGLVATLLLHLIEIRSQFFVGGEDRIAWALLSFIMGVILLEDMEINLGESTAFSYRVALFCAISFFNFYNSMVYRMPLHWAFWFLLHEALIVLLWVVTHRIARACAVRDKKAVARAGDGGIFSQRDKEAEQVKERERELQTKEKNRLLDEEERRIRSQSIASLSAEDIFSAAHGTGEKKIKQRLEAAEHRFAESRPDWSKKLPGAHPGRVLVLFSLVAIPLFGLGIYLFDFSEPGARIRTAIRFFVYLWCLMALFCLASLNQLRAYFRQRKVTMPESIGFVWISLGLLIVTAVLTAAFFLPQPPTLEGAYIRDRILADYRGARADWGFRERLESDRSRAGQGEADGQGETGETGDGEGADGGSAEGEAGGGGQEGQGESAKNGENAKGESRREEARETRERQAEAQRSAAARDPNLGKGFGRILGAIKVLVGIAALVLAGGLVVMLIARARSSANRLAALRLRHRPKHEKRRRQRLLQGMPAKFSEYKSPFGGAEAALEDGQLVRYCWAALTAVCEDRGDPVAAGQTPDEYLATRPEGLRGFEPQARWLADRLTVSEFSGQPLASEDYEALRDWWTQLRRFAEKPA